MFGWFKKLEKKQEPKPAKPLLKAAKPMLVADGQTFYLDYARNGGGSSAVPTIYSVSGGKYYVDQDFVQFSRSSAKGSNLLLTNNSSQALATSYGAALNPNKSISIPNQSSIFFTAMNSLGFVQISYESTDDLWFVIISQLNSQVL